MTIKFREVIRHRSGLKITPPAEPVVSIIAQKKAEIKFAEEHREQIAAIAYYFKSYRGMTLK
jgi:hypothetical protein